MDANPLTTVKPEFLAALAQLGRKTQVAHELIVRLAAYSLDDFGLCIAEDTSVLQPIEELIAAARELHRQM